MYHKKVLSFGYRKEVTDAAKRLNYELVSIIDDWDRPNKIPECQAHETRIYTQNNVKLELILGALSREGQLKFDGVFSTFEYFILNASLLGEHLSKPFMPPLTAMAFRNKYLQKKLLSKTIDSNSFRILNLREMDERHKIDDFPLVLKPIAGGGSEDTFIVRDIEEYTDKINYFNKKGVLKLFEERFISGEEYHADGWVSNGEIKFFAVSKYGKPCINIQNGWLLNDTMLRPESHASLYEEVGIYLKETLQTLNLENGVFHMEFFIDPLTNAIVFGECASRIPGNYIAETFKQMFDIDLYEVLLQISVGETVEAPDRGEITHYYGYTHLPSPSKKSTSLPSEKDVLELDGVVTMMHEWTTGEPIPDITEATSNRVGKVVVKSRTREGLQDKIRKIRKFYMDHYEKIETN